MDMNRQFLETVASLEAMDGSDAVGAALELLSDIDPVIVCTINTRRDYTKNELKVTLAAVRRIARIAREALTACS